MVSKRILMRFEDSFSWLILFFFSCWKLIKHEEQSGKIIHFHNMFPLKKTKQELEGNRQS